MMIPDQNIDPLFNDLKGLEVAPSDRVWKGVEEHLNKKKKRLIPLFWQMGVAASVLILVGLFFFYSGNFNSPDEKVAIDPVNPSMEPVQKGPVFAKELKSEHKGSKREVGKSATDSKTPEEFPADAKRKRKRNLPHEVTSERQLLVLAKSSGVDNQEEGMLLDKKMIAHGYSSQAWQVESPDIQKIAILKKDKTVLPDARPFDSLIGDKAQKPSLRFVLGGEYSPTFAFRETSGGVSTNNSESGINKAGGGISLAVKMNDRLQIETGVKYAMVGQEVNAMSRSDRVYSFSSSSAQAGLDITEVNLSNSLGVVRRAGSPSPIQETNIFMDDANALVELRGSNFVNSGNPILEQSLGYLQVPLTIRYKLLQRSLLDVSLSGGISTNWLIDNNAYLEMGGERKRVGQTQGVSEMGFSTHAGVAVSLPVFKGIHLRMEPRIDYFLSDISKDTPGQFRPYSFGVFTGLFYEW